MWFMRQVGHMFESAKQSSRTRGSRLWSRLTRAAPVVARESEKARARTLNSMLPEALLAGGKPQSTTTK